MTAPKFLLPILAMIGEIRDALSKDSEGGRKVTAAELRAIADKALDTVKGATAGPVEVGDTVLVRVNPHWPAEAPVYRPAIVTAAFGPGYVNCTIFPDPYNDKPEARFNGCPGILVPGGGDGSAIVMAYCASLSEGDGVWQWKRA